MKQSTLSCPLIRHLSNSTRRHVPTSSWRTLTTASPCLRRTLFTAVRPAVVARTVVPGLKHSACGCACACGSSQAPRKKTAYIALGSNLGDRVAEIERACDEMDKRGIKVKRTSSLWETEPMYVKDQDRFVNGACEVCLSIRRVGHEHLC